MDPGTANTAVVTAFQGLSSDIIATMAPIAIAAVSIAAVLLAFKYGRKILNTVAK